MTNNCVVKIGEVYVAAETLTVSLIQRPRDILKLMTRLVQEILGNYWSML